MRIFGLVGYPLEHSWSPAYFASKFTSEHIHDSVYRLFPMSELDKFRDLLDKTQELSGLNVTIPHKISIIPYLNELDVVASEIGAVNTITIYHSGSKVYTCGYNTDMLGFRKSLLFHLQPHHTRALVLGTGGASRAVTYVLGKLGIDFTLVSRQFSGEGIIKYTSIGDISISEYPLIINTTPAGQSPEPGSPLHKTILSQLSSRHLLFDLIYNPPETEFLQAGKEAGAICVNGIEMLTHQADESWKIWNQKLS